MIYAHSGLFTWKGDVSCPGPRNRTRRSWTGRSAFMTGSTKKSCSGHRYALARRRRPAPLRGPGAGMVIDGPFAETKEQLLGFYVVDCASEDAALEIARDCAASIRSGGLRGSDPSCAIFPGRPVRTRKLRSRRSGLKARLIVADPPA